MKRTIWVDFAAVRAAVGIQEVLSYYNVTWLTPVRDELVGRCPVHASNDMQSKAFRANVGRGIWKCFSCGQGGNVVDLVAAMEQCTPHDAALQLVDRYGLSGVACKAPERTQKRGKNIERQVVPERSIQPPEREIWATRAADVSRRGGGGMSDRAAGGMATEEINPALAFELKFLNPNHPYLAERRLTPATVRTFGLGYCAKGMLRGRVAIPIHDAVGTLVGYAGRLVPAEVALARETEAEGGVPPPYRFPSREKGFYKRYLLFNLHRVGERARQDGLVVVEGFFDCFRLHQAGVQNVVALMGCQLSKEQEQLLLTITDHVTLALDRDEAGQQGTQDILARLVTKCFVRILDYPATQPDDLSEEQLRVLFGERHQ